MCVLSFLGLLSNYHRLGVLKTSEMYCLTVLKARISHSLYRAMPSLKVPGKIPLPLPSFLAILGIHGVYLCHFNSTLIFTWSFPLYSVCLNVFPYKDTSHWIIEPTLI